MSGIVARGSDPLRHSIARLHLGSIRDRLPELGSALFVTYFPQVDKLEAEKGVFRNKYALALQDKAAMLRIPVTWLLMFEPLDGYDFKASVRLAAVFARHGEKVLMLEEFFTLKNFFMCVASWVREVLVAGYLLGRIDKKVLLAEPVGEENTALVRALWRKSFYGSRGIGGLIYYYMFRSMFREIRDTHDCVYYCEMQPWEKALNAARRVNPGRFRTIGFQHSSFSKNYFHYFYDKTELAGRGDATDLPLPDVMSCNGERAYAMFTGSGYRNVRKAESVRYLYLDTALSSDQSRARDDRPVLLVAGSVNREESLRLIRLTHEAFRKGMMGLRYGSRATWYAYGQFIQRTRHRCCRGRVSSVRERYRIALSVCGQHWCRADAIEALLSAVRSSSHFHGFDA